MEISAWYPMNRTRRKKGPLAGLMTRVVTWRASPSSQFPCSLRLHNRRRFFFSFNFSFYTVFAVRCASVEFPHDATSSCRFFSFFFFLHAPKCRTHARNQGPLIIIILLCLSFQPSFSLRAVARHLQLL